METKFSWQQQLRQIRTRKQLNKITNLIHTLIYWHVGTLNFHGAFKHDVNPIKPRINFLANLNLKLVILYQRSIRKIILTAILEYAPCCCECTERSQNCRRLISRRKHMSQRRKVPQLRSPEGLAPDEPNRFLEVLPLLENKQQQFPLYSLNNFCTLHLPFHAKAISEFNRFTLLHVTTNFLRGHYVPGNIHFDDRIIFNIN